MRPFSFFYAFGALAWVAAAFFGNDAWSLWSAILTQNALQNMITMHSQGIEFGLSIGLAIIGTLLIGFGALLEQGRR